MANCPEDDLPALQALPERARRWTITTVGSAAAGGLHRRHQLHHRPERSHGEGQRAHRQQGRPALGRKDDFGQGASCRRRRTSSKCRPDAVADDGQQSIVFVQTDAAKTVIHDASRRTGGAVRSQSVFVRNRPFTKDEELTVEEKRSWECSRSGRCCPANESWGPGVGELEIGPAREGIATSSRVATRIAEPKSAQ